MRKPKPTLEKYIERQIINYLRSQRWLAFKVRTSGRIVGGKVYSLPKDELGVADVIACCPKGLFHAFEIKNEKGRQSDYQKGFEWSVKRTGGRYTILRSLDEAISYVQNNS